MGMLFDEAEGRWLSAVEAAARQKASQTRPRRVTRGMTRQQVRDLLGGDPDGVRRSLTGIGLAEQWVYHGNPPLIVTFHRGYVESVFPPEPGAE